MKQYWLSLCALALIGFTGCSKDDKPEKPTDGKFSQLWHSAPEILENTYVITDETQTPINGAQILIGNAQNNPFPDNFLTTNEQGQFQIPGAWTEAQNLTIDAPGYMRVTFINELPHPRAIILKKIQPIPQHIVTGVTTGHPIQDKDSIVDFSLVMPAMTKYDLLNLDLNKVISPEKDTITAAGQEMTIPSNVSLPKQKESYFIGVTLEKPIYRLAFSEAGPQRIYAARGRFPFKAVVDELRNNAEFFDLINYFDITGGTIKDVQVSGASTSLDLNVKDMNYKAKLNVVAPTLKSGQVEVAVGVANINGTLFPTDVKRLNSKEKMQLAVLDASSSLIAHVLKNSSEFDTAKPGADRLSGALLPFTDNSQAQFLSLIQNPTKVSDYSFKFDVPAAVNTIFPIASYSVISDIKSIKDAKGNTNKVATKIWEIYNPKWDSQLNLPQWPTNAVGTKKRVEVSFIGSLNNQNVEMGTQVIEAATHITRSSLEY